MSDAGKPPSETGLSRSETAAVAVQRAISRGLELLSPSTVVSTIEPLALMIQYHIDSCTGCRRPPDTSRVLRIRHYAVALARTQNLSEREIRAIEIGALLDDCGWLALTPSFHFDPDREDWRWETDKFAAMILNAAPALAPAAPFVRVQYGGWRNGPLGKRILGIAQTYDQLTQGSRWGETLRKLNAEDACKELRERPGLDPDLVDDFCRIAADVTKSFRVPDDLADLVGTLDEAAKAEEEEPDADSETPPAEVQPVAPPPITRTITLAEGMTLKDLADKLDVQLMDVLAKLFDEQNHDFMKQIMMTINSTLDIESARDIAREFGAIEPTFKEVRIGTAEIRQVFRVPKVGAIAGCRVTEGRVRRFGGKVRLLRDNAVVYEGRIASLRRLKNYPPEVKAGNDCGIRLEHCNDVEVGDVIEVFRA